MTTTVSGGASPGIPGLTSDGARGIVVTGGIQAGTDGANDLFLFIGSQTIQNSADSGNALLELDQTAALGSAFGDGSALRILRGFQPTNHTIAPVIYIENDDSDSIADAISYFGPLGGEGFKLGVESGIGMHNHASQTTPRTLAQSVITAITDANAKIAVQACANALVDIGALTLT